jgi:hypothetical protein
MFIFYGLISEQKFLNNLKLGEMSKSVHEYVAGHISQETKVTTKSVLVAVTGGWAIEGFRTETRLLYLHNILTNFVASCESGFKIKVVLYTYDIGFKDWEKYIDVSEYWCSRIDAPLDIQMEFYEFRKLNPKAFGTAGDLVIRHREIFLREINNFNIFVVQEDDVSVRKVTLDYAYFWLEFFNSTSYHPAFFDLEVLGGDRYVSYRIKTGQIFSFKGRLFSRVLDDGCGGRSYAITRNLLREWVVDKKEWIDPNLIIGEFNPLVGSSSWFKSKHQVELLLPIENSEWKKAAIHHLPNKYIQSHFQSSTVKEEYFEFITEEELALIFQSCLVDSKQLDSNFLNMTFEGPTCLECVSIHEKSATYIARVYRNLDEQLRGVSVSFECS